MMLGLAVWTWLGVPALVGGVLMVIWRLSSVRDRGRRRAPGRAATRTDRTEPSALRADVAELLTRLEQVSARVDAQAAGRLAQLERALSVADERVARLEATLAAVESWRHGRVTAARGALAAESRSDERRVSRSDLVRSQPAAGAIAPPEATGVAVPADPRAAEDDARFLAVYDLADQGMPMAAIGRQVGLPAGEVELILSLRSLR